MPQPLTGSAIRGGTAVLAVFTVGALLGIPGVVMPGWGYGARPAFLPVSVSFLAYAAGIFSVLRPARYVLEQRGVRGCLVLGTGLAFFSLSSLTLISPPRGESWLAWDLFVLGLAMGCLLQGASQTLQPLLRWNLPGTLSLALAAYTLGLAVTAVLFAVSLQRHALTELLFGFALLTALLLWPYARLQPAPLQVPYEARPMRSTEVVLVALLATCQLGIELCMGAWLPIYVMQRLNSGVSTALLLLSLYWLLVLSMRLAAHTVLEDSGRIKAYLLGMGAAFFGCVFLATAESLLAVAVGVSLLAAVHGATLPLALQGLRCHFSGYDPSRLGEHAATGLAAALLSPWLVGYSAHIAGLRVMVLVPLAGTLLAFVLALLLLLECRIVRSRFSAAAS